MPHSPTKMSDSDVSDSELSTKMSDSDISEPPSPREKSELELLREQNIKERDAYIASLLKDPEYADIMETINTLKDSRPKKQKVKKDPTFRPHVLIPLERRKSARLENKPPIFTQYDLIDKPLFKRKRYDDDDYEDLEDIVYRPRKSTARPTKYVQAIPVENVTEKMIENIARRVVNKVYSDSGTSCHQCRQKTLDQKTCCRSNMCVGIRGQFCGVCLENRYGEDAAVALKDPNWHCPVCRGICNCSFCRAKAGKRPTGILTPRAHLAGHRSVKHFLESLRGEGDYPHHDNLWNKLNNPKYLLGFSDDLSIAYMGGGVQHKIEYYLSIEKMQMFLQKKQEELTALIELHEDPYDLLGFVENNGNAQMSNNNQCDMQILLSLEKLENFIYEKQKELQLMSGML